MSPWGDSAVLGVFFFLCVQKRGQVWPSHGSSEMLCPWLLKSKRRRWEGKSDSPSISLGTFTCSFNQKKEEKKNCLQNGVSGTLCKRALIWETLISVWSPIRTLKGWWLGRGEERKQFFQKKRSLLYCLWVVFNSQILWNPGDQPEVGQGCCQGTQHLGNRKARPAHGCLCSRGRPAGEEA